MLLLGVCTEEPEGGRRFPDFSGLSGLSGFSGFSGFSEVVGAAGFDHAVHKQSDKIRANRLSLP